MTPFLSSSSSSTFSTSPSSSSVVAALGAAYKMRAASYKVSINTLSTSFSTSSTSPSAAATTTSTTTEQGASSSSIRSSKFLIEKGDAWKLGELHKASLGTRSIIVGAGDDTSLDLSKKMWFHLQKVGIDATFFTLKVPFVDSSILDEGVVLARRTGATSIISIGSGTPRDFGMGLKYCLDNNISKASNLESSIFSNINSNRINSHSNVVCVNVASDVSPLASLNQWKAFHFEDNILMQYYGSQGSPDIVVFDKSIIDAVPSSLMDVSMCSTMAYLIDSTFSFAFTQLSQGKSSKEVTDIFAGVVERASKSFTDLGLTKNEKSLMLAPQYQLAILISCIQNRLVEEGFVDKLAAPTILNTLADLRDVQLLSKFRLQVPCSWSMVEMMAQYVDHCKTYMNNPPRNINEELIHETVKLSTDFMFKCTDMKEEHILDMIKVSKEVITKFAALNPKKYSPSKVSENYVSQTADGLLEGLVLTEEERANKLAALGRKAGPVSIYDEAVRKDSSASKPFVSKLDKGSKVYDIHQCKTILLKSDFMSDLAETVLKTYL